MVKLVSRWLKRPWILIGDGAYACMKLAQNCAKHKVTLISRLRLDAQLFESPEWAILDSFKTVPPENALIRRCAPPSPQGEKGNQLF